VIMALYKYFTCLFAGFLKIFEKTSL